MITASCRRACMCVRRGLVGDRDKAITLHTPHARRVSCRAYATTFANGGDGGGGDAQKIETDIRNYVDRTLRVNEKHVVIDSANDPCEDEMSSSYCRLSSTWLFGVFDGHAGNTCARHVAARLFDYVCATALATHTQQTPSSADNVQGEKIERLLRDHRARLAQIDMRKHEHAVGEFARRFAEAGHDVSSVVVALQVCVCNEVRTGCQAAFVALDDDLSSAAKLPSAIDADLRAVESGCCACVAHVHGRDVHIAYIGDSQAILGTQNENGAWTARRLSHKHTVDNANEVQRVRAAHPNKESDWVLRGGRLLGQLYPLRAFGDVGLKWPADLQENILRTNRVPRRLETPPYLIATPEVINHQLSVGDRFIVIASDGLWDMLTPDSVVRLLADHWHGRRTSVAAATGVVTADDIEQVLMSVNLGGRVSLCARERIQKCTQHSADDPTPPAPPAANVATPTPPVDSNAATHVIRHALGGMRPSTQYDRLFTQLRMPAKQAREYRDDMTVQVIYFNEEYIGAHRNHK